MDIRGRLKERWRGLDFGDKLFVTMCLSLLAVALVILAHGTVTGKPWGLPIASSLDDPDEFRKLSMFMGMFFGGLIILFSGILADVLRKENRKRIIDLAVIVGAILMLLSMRYLPPNFSP